MYSGKEQTINLETLANRAPNLQELVPPHSIDLGLGLEFCNILMPSTKSDFTNINPKFIRISESINQFFTNFKNLKRLDYTTKEIIYEFHISQLLEKFKFTQIQDEEKERKFQMLYIPQDSKLQDLQIKNPLFANIVFPQKGIEAKRVYFDLQNVQIVTDQMGQLEVLTKLQAYCKDIQKIVIQANFVDTSMKYFQLKI